MKQTEKKKRINDLTPNDWDLMRPRHYAEEVALSKQDEGPDDMQVGGNHYVNKAIQPWDFIISNNLGFLEGNIIKYITRYKTKNGVQDLEKGLHYLRKLIEEEKRGE